MFFSLGWSYAFGLWFGLGISLLTHFLVVYRTKELVQESDGGNGVGTRVSLLAGARYLLYGLALVVSVLTAWLDFFATAGGILLPIMVLQLKTATGNFSLEDSDA